MSRISFVLLCIDLLSIVIDVVSMFPLDRADISILFYLLLNKFSSAADFLDIVLDC